MACTLQCWFDKFNAQDVSWSAPRIMSKIKTRVIRQKVIAPSLSLLKSWRFIDFQYGSYMWRYKSHAITGRTARCSCKFRYVSKFTAASHSFSATARLSSIGLHQQPFKC